MRLNIRYEHQNGQVEEFNLKLLSAHAEDKRESHVLPLWHGALRMALLTEPSSLDALVSVLRLMTKAGFAGWIVGNFKAFPVAFNNYSIDYTKQSMPDGTPIFAEVTVSYRVQQPQISGKLV